MNPQGMPDPATQYAQLKSAVLGAQQAGGASPLGSFPELQKLTDDTASLEPKSQAVAGAAYNASVQDANAKAAAATKIKQEQDMLDPSKYTKVPLSDGGYKFLAPNGQEISANDYSRITGSPVDKVLADSRNPIDISFQQDYNQLQTYMHNKIASHSNNPDPVAKEKALLAAQQTEQAVQKAYGVDLSKMEIPDVLSKFQQAYPTVFGQGGLSGPHTAGAPAGTTFFGG